MLKTKKLIVLSVLSAVSVYALMSCSDKSSSSSKNYSVQEETASSVLTDDGNTDLPCRAEAEAIFDAMDNCDPMLLLSYQYPPEYLEALEANDPDEFDSLYEEASEMTGEMADITAELEKKYSAPITYETNMTGYEKLDSEDLMFVEENLTRMYESIGLEPPKVTDGYAVFCNMQIKAGGEAVEEMEEG